MFVQVCFTFYIDMKMLKYVSQYNVLRFWDVETAEEWMHLGCYVMPFFSLDKFPHLKREYVSGRTVKNRVLLLICTFGTEDYKKCCT